MATKNQSGQTSVGFIQVGGSSGGAQAPKPAQGYPTSTAKPQAAPPQKKCGSCGKW